MLVDVREMRAILEVFRDSGAQGTDLDALGAKALELSSDLASLPLPRDLVSRAVVADRALREEVTILLWHVYSAAFRRRSYGSAAIAKVSNPGKVIA